MERDTNRMEQTATPHYLRLADAIGIIQAGPEQQERLDEITERLQGDEFYVAAERAIPSKCIDGRVGAEGLAPNAAGGSETLLVADDLTNQRFAGDGSTVSAYNNILDFLLQAGLPVGGHTDEHAAGEKSGCGANDRLPEIYAFIAQHGDVLKQLAETLGAVVPTKTHDLITKNAQARTDFSSGAQMLETLRDMAGDAAIDPLRGDHKEVVAVINAIPRTTLDRTVLEAEFGAHYEAFNVDIWSFTDAARAISLDNDELIDKNIAMVYYNLATAHVLCGPNMRVIVRDLNE